MQKAKPEQTKHSKAEIPKIRRNFPDKAVSATMDLPTNVRCLSNFEKTTADEIRQIVLSHGIKCSPELRVVKASSRTMLK